MSELLKSSYSDPRGRVTPVEDGQGRLFELIHVDLLSSKDGFDFVNEWCVASADNQRVVTKEVAVDVPTARAFSKRKDKPLPDEPIAEQETITLELYRKCLLVELMCYQLLGKNFPQHAGVVYPHTFTLTQGKKSNFLTMECLFPGLKSDARKKEPHILPLNIIKTRVNDFVQFCMGASLLHELGIANNDLKLENSGSKWTSDNQRLIMSFDFGMACDADTFTPSGAAMYTANYNPIFARTPVDVLLFSGDNHDIYSHLPDRALCRPQQLDLAALNISFFELLTNRNPREVAVETILNASAYQGFQTYLVAGQPHLIEMIERKKSLWNMTSLVKSVFQPQPPEQQLAEVYHRWYQRTAQPTTKIFTIQELLADYGRVLGFTVDYSKTPWGVRWGR